VRIHHHDLSRARIGDHGHRALAAQPRTEGHSSSVRSDPSARCHPRDFGAACGRGSRAAHPRPAADETN
jgi:hypothetical protein